MIQISVHPNEVPINELTDLVVRLTNVSHGYCTGIRLSFRVPKEVVLVRGSGQFKVDLIEPKKHYDHAIRIRAKAPGKFTIVFTNFSYFDPSGSGQRIRDSFASLLVTDSIPCLVSELQLQITTSKLNANQWSAISGTITNIGSDVAQQVVLVAHGPTLEARNVKIDNLKVGESKTFELVIQTKMPGTHVPVEITAIYKNRNKKTLQSKWTFYLNVEEQISPTSVNYQSNFYGSIDGSIHTGSGNIHQDKD